MLILVLLVTLLVHFATSEDIHVPLSLSQSLSKMVGVTEAPIKPVEVGD